MYSLHKIKMVAGLPFLDHDNHWIHKLAALLPYTLTHIGISRPNKFENNKFFLSKPSEPAEKALEPITYGRLHYVLLYLSLVFHELFTVLNDLTIGRLEASYKIQQNIYDDVYHTFWFPSNMAFLCYPCIYKASHGEDSSTGSSCLSSLLLGEVLLINAVQAHQYPFEQK